MLLGQMKERLFSSNNTEGFLFYIYIVLNTDHMPIFQDIFFIADISSIGERRHFGETQPIFLLTVLISLYYCP